MSAMKQEQKDRHVPKLSGSPSGSIVFITFVETKALACVSAIGTCLLAGDRGSEIFLFFPQCIFRKRNI